MNSVKRKQREQPAEKLRPDEAGLPRTNSRLKKVVFRLAAVVVSLVAAVLLFELFLRVFQIKPVRYPPEQILVWDGIAFREKDAGKGRIKTVSQFPDAGVQMGEYVPGAAFKLVFPDNPRGYFDQSNAVLMTINSLGLRGEEVSMKKPAGTYRILGIGDSFAFGEGVKDEDTFLHRLQIQLNGNAAGQKRFEVLNAGVQGYNTRDEVIYLERRWLALAPDLVLIIFYINDAYNDGVIRNRGQELGIYQQQPAGLAQYSYLWDLVQHRYQTHETAKTVEAFYRTQFFTNAESFMKNSSGYKVDWTDCEAALEHAAQLARARKFKLGLVMFPELYKLDGNYPFHGIHKLVREACERREVPFLDLLETFRGRNPESLWVHPSNHHPNETAHGLAEVAIEKFVREEFLSSASNAKSAATQNH